MSKRIIYSFIIATSVFTVLIMTACNKESAPPPAPANYSWTEEFDTLANAMARGWAVSNNSSPIGVSSWEQGHLIVEDPNKKILVTSNPFLAASATYSGKDFTIAGYNSGNGTSTISCWLITPPMKLKNGDKFSFYTRTVPTSVNATRPDRLQVWFNATSNSTNVGSLPTETGDFKIKLVDINPTYVTSGAGEYPRDWAKYEVTISGIPAPVDRRIAFRYFVENGGPGGLRSYGVGIDKVEFTSF